MVTASQLCARHAGARTAGPLEKAKGLTSVCIAPVAALRCGLAAVMRWRGEILMEALASDVWCPCRGFVGRLWTMLMRVMLSIRHTSNLQGGNARCRQWARMKGSPRPTHECAGMVYDRYATPNY